MFKEKSSKKRITVSDNEKDNSTLDLMHNKIIKTFNNTFFFSYYSIKNIA